MILGPFQAALSRPLYLERAVCLTKSPRNAYTKRILF